MGGIRVAENHSLVDELERVGLHDRLSKPMNYYYRHQSQPPGPFIENGLNHIISKSNKGTKILAEIKRM